MQKNQVGTRSRPRDSSRKRLTGRGLEWQCSRHFFGFMDFRERWLVCVKYMCCRWLRRLFRTVTRRKCHINFGNTRSHHLQRSR